MALSKSKFRQDITKDWFALSRELEIECSRFDVRSPAYVNIQQKNIAPVRKLVEKNLLPEKKDREIATRTAVEHCIHGWRTIVTPAEYDDKGVMTRAAETRPEIEDEPGEWLPFTLENAVTIFLKYPALYYDVIDYARDVSNFQLTDDERKNSKSA